MAATRIRIVGPTALAMSTVTQIADAIGIELTSSEPPVRSEGLDGSVVLVVTVEGTDEAVRAAIGSVRCGLPAGASIDVE